MNTLNEDLIKEYERIKKLMTNGESLKIDDLKILLLAQLAEEDSNERHQ
ncbi:MAG: hypothetical protein HOP07_10675 [Bacteriovoracaceae bacterium]|nr:hypothetical protein [Bacteriovoracaceae bacterium]